MGMRVTVLLLLTLWTLLSWHAASQTASTCERGWFGSSCQYKCRCRNDNCTTEGDCLDGLACDRGWFGPACQYADLAYRARSSQAKATDGDDSSCLTLNFESVVITLNQPTHFTWLRIRLSNPDLLYNLRVHFRTDASLSCTNNRTARVDNTTLDIHCDLNETVEHVILSGTGVQDLCSVYISGGRNVALNQSATQSSTYSATDGTMYGARRAVDGNRTADFTKGTCTHTANNLPHPNLNVTFARLHHINRYVLYNRASNQERLQTFELRSFNSDLAPVLHYQDNSSTDQSVYTVTPESVDTAILLVNVEAHNIDNILTLCELEIYGDSVCQPRQYGRVCEHSCNCAGGQSCFVSTGGCPSGCAAGYLGPDCWTRCEQGRYGPGCQFSCSQFCVRDNGTRAHFCANTDGTCLHGCQGGYQGSTCTEEVSHIDNVVVVSAVVGVVAVALMVIIVIILFCRRYRRSAKQDDLVMGDLHVKKSTDANPSTPQAGLEATNGDSGYENPAVSTEVTERAAQIASQGEIASADMFGDDSMAHTYESVGHTNEDSMAHTYEDSVAQTYNEIDDNVACPYETVVDDSNKDIPSTHNCSEYANTL